MGLSRHNRHIYLFKYDMIYYKNNKPIYRRFKSAYCSLINHKAHKGKNKNWSIGCFVREFKRK